tara:strand:- start:33 stop:221 length:189 start_codon:yes stop_codon:yes gene_type:complete
MKLSNQAIGALLVTLQKCLSEETDITELLSDWNLSIVDDEIHVDNPPAIYVSNEEERKFETE